jgi:tetratricopeptide (TPR) repeat protein
VFLPCVAALVLAAAPSAEELLAWAESAFGRGLAARSHPAEARQAFAEAANAFELLYQSGVQNPDLCRNEAHAAWLAGRLPQAILAYRRGLRLDPQDAALQQELEQARDQVAYPSAAPVRPPPPAWPAWLPYPSAVLLLVLALGSYAVGWMMAARWLVARREQPVLAAAAAFLIAAVLGGGYAWQQADLAWEAQHPLVVVRTAGAALRTGNGPSYPRHETLPALARGMEGRRLFERGDWLQVEFPGGLIGWVRAADVLVD